MAKLITETSFKALIQAIGKKLGQIDTQVATDKSKLADLETNFGTKAVQAINNELGRDILEVKADAEDTKRLFGDLKTTMFGSKEPYKVAKDSDIDTISSHLQSLRSEIQGATAQTGTIVNEYMKVLLGTKNEGGEEVPNDPYIVAKASELETLKGKVDTFFAGATFDREGNNVIDTLKEIVDYLNTNPTGTTAVADIRDLKNVVNRLTYGDGLYNDNLESNLEKINSTRPISWRINKALEQYVTTSKLSEQLNNYVNNSNLLDFDDSIRLINEHLFDNKLVVTKSGTDNVDINLNATDPQVPKEDRL